MVAIGSYSPAVMPARPKKTAALTPAPARDLLTTSLDAQRIYCGDNLDVLRRMPAGCVDLIYIDPPFNSNRNYEVFWGEAKEKRSFEDRHESTRAYIDYMRPRCVELARVLKKTGSFYYHCDWHASHYVKVMLDQIFGEDGFRNEIVWKRSSAHSDGKQGSKHFGRVHDVLLFYTAKAKGYTWNPLYTPLKDKYVKSKYCEIDENGDQFRWDNITGPGGAAKGNPYYEVLGVSGYWRFKRERMAELVSRGLIAIPPGGEKPQIKRYLKDSKGVPLQSVWDDLPPVNSQAKEAQKYPTQKPLGLLERIVRVSSDPGDIVLDAFCGCGTAIVAAQQLDRRWAGIDISPTACRVMADRLRKACGLREGVGFHVVGLPRSEEQLRRMPHFEFENWAVVALGGIPNKTKTGDMGIDGRVFPVRAISADIRKKPGQLDFMDLWYPVQVKQKDKAGRPDIDSFEAVMMREDRQKGFFVSFDFTSDAEREVATFFKRSGRVIVPLTVREILDEEIARKLV